MTANTLCGHVSPKGLHALTNQPTDRELQSDLDIQFENLVSHLLSKTPNIRIYVTVFPVFRMGVESGFLF
jgi:hypothetical protein